MDTALVFERRSTCDRNHVGAVIAREGRIIATGYNGAPAGLAHCVHVTSPARRMALPGERGCDIAIHAEANAIAYAARHGVSVEGATIFTTLSPCHPCSQLIVAAGLGRVVYRRAYRLTTGLEVLTAAGLTVDQG
jgi:dCMP deaminase